MSHDSCGGFCLNTLLDSELLVIERDSAPLRAKGFLFYLRGRLSGASAWMKGCKYVRDGEMHNRLDISK